MILFLFLIKTYLIFVLFTFIISMFGGCILFLFQEQSKKKWNLTLLEKIYISYALGVVIYINLAYILNLYEIFNFYSAYLPLLIVSFTFLLYLYKKKKILAIFNLIRANFRSNQKAVKLNVLILFVNFFFQFLVFWPKVSESTALLIIDPYLWTREILYLNKYGFVNYVDLGYSYPWGFIFFSGGNLLISPDLTTTYYFMKLACFPYLNFYTLVIFSISKRIFERPSLIFFCLISILPNTFFLLRTIMFLSSSISILLILISFVIILTKIPNYFLCLIISGTILMNPVYTLFYVMALTIFYFIKVVNHLRKIIFILLEFFSIILLSIVFLIPHFLNMWFLFKRNLIEIIRSFFWLFTTSYSDRLNTVTNLSRNIILISNSLTLSNYVVIGISYYLLELMHQIFLYVFLTFFSILGLFFTKRKGNENYKDFIVFIKIGLILLLIIAFLLQLFERNFFFYVFNIRIVEAFYPCMIFSSGFFIEWILKIFDKKWQNKRFNYNNFDEFKFIQID